ncbi:MAG: NYN domain-containing protein, partial [Nocardioides sp.]|nr:NYN domain-containing protein [Nocardioides sp.]
ELRQAQARLARYDAEAGAERRSARTERDEATLRARLLLDTVLDAAAGLQRELALPSVAGSPAERVEQGLGSEGVRHPSASGQLGPDSGPLLDQYLTMPRARLVVDGYNVTKSVWGSLPLESQRIRLVNALASVVARTGAETTVVFDAHQAGGHRPVVAAPRGVRVVFSPDGVIADDVIRDLVAVEPTGRVVVVVTADAELAGDVRRDGARVSAPASLLALLGS